MKKIKKLSALLLALVMLFALAMPAMAAGTDKITVNNIVAGESYAIYKLFDLEVNNETDPTAFSYTVNKDWTTFFATGGAGAQYVTINENNYVTDISDAAALAKAASEWNGKPAALDTKEAEGTSVEFTGLDHGYYLITSTLGTLAMTDTTPAKGAVTINEKNPKDTIEKQVKEDELWAKENDAQVGDKVEFKSTITLVKGTTNVKVHDTMDAGLTYNNDAAIAGLTKDKDYTIETCADHTFCIKFDEDYLAKLAGNITDAPDAREKTTLTLTYSAILNENAVVKGDGGVTIVDQYNNTNITYGNAQTVTSQTKTTTHKSTVNKYAAGEENLAGAEFSLKKNDDVVPLIKLDNQNYRVANGNESGAVNTFVTVSDGDIVIWGLDTDGDYTLEEINAPDGYNKLTAEAELEVNADNTAIANIENKSGTELPSTGGMGTTMFYAVGGLMILAAVVLLVTKKRMSAE